MNLSPHPRPQIAILSSVGLLAILAGGAYFFSKESTKNTPAEQSQNQAITTPTPIVSTTPAATPSATVTSSTPATNTERATMKQYLFNGKPLFSYPSKFSLIESIYVPDGGGTQTTLQLGLQNESTGSIELLPITISSLSPILFPIGDTPPTLDQVLRGGFRDDYEDYVDTKKEFTNSAGTNGISIVTGKAPNSYYISLAAGKTGRDYGWKVSLEGDGYRKTLLEEYPEKSLLEVYNQIVDSLATGQ